MGKTRLAPLLDDVARTELIAAMLDRVVAVARACRAIDRVCIVGPPDFGLGGVTLLEDSGGGLNTALTEAVAQVSAIRAAEVRPAQTASAAPQRIIIVVADLPRIEPEDLALLADARREAIAIAPDRHGTGTNALSLPLAAAHAFEFHFGPNSYVAHCAEARRLGYGVETILSDGLEKDIDEPRDLQDASGFLQGLR